MGAAPSIGVVCHEYGDAGVLVDLLSDEYEERWTAAQLIGQALRSSPPPGFVDVVASFENVFVSFDPLVTDHATMQAVVEDLVGHAAAPLEPRRFLVPVVYGGEAGPDLRDVAELCGWTTDEVVEAHAGEDWVVRFVGSPVGAPMMDGPRLPRSVPRLATPRTRLVPGSVGVSGFQSIIYNAPSPGGWRIIGLTPSVLFDLDQPPHIAYRPGDRFRFLPIAPDGWESWHRPLEVGPGSVR